MVQIVLPINENKFCVIANSTIEKHVFDKFFPYTEFFDNKNDLTLYELVFSFENGCVSALKKGVCIYSKRVVNDFDAYKTIIALLRENMISTGDLCLVHAAFVDVLGKGILLLGQSGVGKSTLSAFLNCQPGIVCYSDDITLVDCSKKTIVNLSKFISIRKEAMPILNLKDEIVYDSFLDRYLIEFSNREDNKKINAIFDLNRNDKVKYPRISECHRQPRSLLAENTYLPYSLKSNLRFSLSFYKSVKELHYSDLEKTYIFFRENICV